MPIHISTLTVMNHKELISSFSDPTASHRYTIDDIVYLRAYTLARIQMQKEQLAGMGRNLTATGSLSGKQSWVGRVLNCFSYFDYVLLGLKLMTGFRSLMRIRKRR